MQNDSSNTQASKQEGLDYKLSGVTDRKFTESYGVSHLGISVKTHNGFAPLKYTHKTAPYTQYKISTSNGLELIGADTHILIDKNFEEVYLKDSEGVIINTQYGDAVVETVERLEAPKVPMYDLSVSGDNTYYTSKILSHNTTCAGAYLLHQAITRRRVSIAVLGNKEATAIEVLDRIKDSYELLPWFLQVGVEVWNKKTIKLGNGSKIFCAASGSSSIRGKTCVTGDTKACVEVCEAIFYSDIDTLKNVIKFNVPSKQLGTFHTAYKTTNKFTGKEYKGVYSTDTEAILFNTDGSIFEDGFLGEYDAIHKDIELYSPEAFAQELLGVFETLEEANNYIKTSS